MERALRGTKYARQRRLLSPTLAYVLAAIAICVIGYFATTAVQLARRTAQSDARLEVSDQLSALRAGLENDIYLNANLVQGLAAAVATEPNMQQQRFAALAGQLFQGRNQLKNIGGAPDLVIRMIYPLSGNERAIGLDYSKNEDQRKAAMQARDTGRMILAGPLDLVQGGRALIARIPVFTVASPESPSRFWGLLSTVIDLDRLYADAGVLNAERKLNLAIRGRDGTGSTGDFFYGDSSIVGRSPVSATVSLPNGSWELLALPKNGWPTASPNEHRIVATFLIGGSLIVIPLLVVGLLLAERRGIMRALLEARDRAESANDAKSQFLSSMSHELRTPMTGIMGMCDLLASGTQPPDQARMVNMLRRSARTLLDLLNDILDLAKIESGRLTIESIDFDLSALLLEVQSLFAQSVTEKNLNFVVDGAAESGEVFRGDPKRLRQILCNLVGNAIKFTEAGTISVKHWQESGQAGRIKLHFSVTDTGIGISEEGLTRLFRKFEQEDAATARRYGGTGLGLAICKQLAEALGGSINVESAKGKGTTFTFSIDVEPGDPAGVMASTLKDGPQGSDQFSGAHWNILLAEDNPTSRFIFEKILTQWGHRIVGVSDGKQALERATAEHFDIILMDMQMPVMDGDEAVRNIRRGNGKCATTPIIALTADGIAEHHRQYRDAGCDDIVTKPVSWNKLARTMKALLNASPNGAVEHVAVSAAPPMSHSVLNDEMVGILKAAVPAAEFGNLLWQSFASIENYLLKLGMNIEAVQLSEAKRTAHALKGLSSQIGADKIAEIAAWIEESSITIDDVKSARKGLGDAAHDLESALTQIAPKPSSFDLHPNTK